MKKKKVYLSAILALGLVSTSISGTYINRVKGEVKAQEYIVIAQDDQALTKVVDKYDLEEIEESHEELNDNHIMVTELTPSEAKKIDKEKKVSVEPDIILTGSQKELKKSNKEGTLEDMQWNMKAINAYGKKGKKQKASGIKIGLIDSGVSYTDDINVYKRFTMLGDEEVSPLYDDTNGHGTQIAGMIGALDNGEGISGVVPGAEICSIKVLNENNQSNLSKIIAGIYCAIDEKVDILNMSFGTNVNSEALHAAIKDAQRAGILMIAAGGNQEHQSIQYPAAYEEVVAVGATDARGQLVEHNATGTELEILAPGENVLSTGLFYGTVGTSGTSIATAQVTGAAAIVWSKDTKKSPQFIRQLLGVTSRVVHNATQYKAGLLDVNSALDNYKEFSKDYKEDKKVIQVENKKRPEQFDDDVVVEGLWQVPGHNKGIEEVAKNNIISSRKADCIALMEECSRLADDKFSETSALHGAGNYLATLKYLHYFAEGLGNGKSEKAAETYADNKIKETQSENLVGTDSMKKLKVAVKSVLATDVSSKMKESSSSVKELKVKGLALHVAGDIFAHRTIVPYSSVEGTNPKKRKGNKIGSDDFLPGGTIQKKEYLQKWTKSPKDNNEKINYTSNSTYMIDKWNKHGKKWNNFQETIKLGYMEFRDIKYYGKQEKKDGKWVNCARGKFYEDNVDFYSSRLSQGSKFAMEQVMNTTYAVVDNKTMLTFNITCLYAKSKYSKFSIKLNGYKSYAEKVDKKGSQVLKDQWSEISTTVVY